MDIDENSLRNLTRNGLPMSDFEKEFALNTYFTYKQDMRNPSITIQKYIDGPFNELDIFKQTSNSVSNQYVCTIFTDLDKEVNGMSKDMERMSLQRPSSGVLVQGSILPSKSDIFSSIGNFLGTMKETPLDYISSSDMFSDFYNMIITSKLGEFFSSKREKGVSQDDSKTGSYTFIVPSNIVIKNSLWYIGRDLKSLTQTEIRDIVLRFMLLCNAEEEIFNVTIITPSKDIPTMDPSYFAKVDRISKEIWRMSGLKLEADDHKRCNNDSVILISDGTFSFPNTVMIEEPSLCVYDFIVSDPSVLEFGRLINAMNLASEYIHNSEGECLTFAIPSNDAMQIFKNEFSPPIRDFSSLSKTFLATLIPILKRHIFKECKPLFYYKSNKECLHDLLNSKVTIKHKPNGGYELNESNVKRCNLKLTNGIVHVIDSLLSVDVKDTIKLSYLQEISNTKKSPSMSLIGADIKDRNSLRQSSSSVPNAFSNTLKEKAKELRQEYHSLAKEHDPLLSLSSPRNVRNVRNTVPVNKKKYEDYDIYDRATILYMKDFSEYMKDSVKENTSFTFNTGIFINDCKLLVDLIQRKNVTTPKEFRTQLDRNTFVYFDKDKLVTILNQVDKIPDLVRTIYILTLISEHPNETIRRDLSYAINAKWKTLMIWDSDASIILACYLEKFTTKVNQFAGKMNAIHHVSQKSFDSINHAIFNGVNSTERKIALEFAVHCVSNIIHELQDSSHDNQSPLYLDHYTLMKGFVGKLRKTFNDMKEDIPIQYKGQEFEDKETLKYLSVKSRLVERLKQTVLESDNGSESITASVSFINSFMNQVSKKENNTSFMLGLCLMFFISMINYGLYNYQQDDKQMNKAQIKERRRLHENIYKELSALQDTLIVMKHSIEGRKGRK